MPLPCHGRACPTAVRHIFCLKRRTALILLGSRRFAIVWTRIRINAVRHQNSVFHDILKLIPWTEFDRLVDEHGSGGLVRKFKTRHQLIALLSGHLAGASSLCEIAASMASHQARLYPIGGQVPRRTTFADASRDRGPL